MTHADLKRRIETIEEGYVFLLSYAAQGTRDDRESKSSGQLRDTLAGMADALDGLADGLSDLVPNDDPSWAAFLPAVARDAATAQAALRLVREREGISSKLVDELNASSHLRALLTDLFLVDELTRT